METHPALRARRNPRRSESSAYSVQAIMSSQRAAKEAEEAGGAAKRRYGALDYAGYGGDAKRQRARAQIADEEGSGDAAMVPEHRRRALTRCVPHRDSGATEGADAGNALFCLDFARGSCPDGDACTHRHEVPKPADDANPSVLNATYDVFGRKRSALTTAWERLHGKKEEGANDLDNAALQVDGLKPPPRQRTELCGGPTGKHVRTPRGALDAAVRKAFGVFGQIAETRVAIRDRKSTAIVVFAGRACAEFAKEAMTGQGLTPESPGILQVRWACEPDAADDPAPNFEPAVRTAPPPLVVRTDEPPKAPPGWSAVLDAKSRRYYYYHADTKQTTWTLPSTAPASEPSQQRPDVEWTEYFDANAQRPYWANTRTREVTWTNPQSKGGDDWVRTVDPATGAPYWANARTRETSWTDPTSKAAATERAESKPTTPPSVEHDRPIRDPGTAEQEGSEPRPALSSPDIAG
ncbi:hypothetical protein CTAYLR_000397 [Chrysophaeum taylorii]|uniref:Uncharacterized protein n=1 Tax=Chrysophaeum taylorii TaxID=2483200 RepID=A0AAD7XJW0_9STRA|nr:hypothetical protein CTAYLR_000397 [Chrysophaeum taylorii]